MQIDPRLTELVTTTKARYEADEKAYRRAQAEKAEQEYQRDVTIFDRVLRQELGGYIDLLQNLQFRRVNAVLTMQAVFELVDPAGRTWETWFELGPGGAKNGEIEYPLGQLCIPDLRNHELGPGNTPLLCITPEKLKGCESWPEALAIALTMWHDDWGIITEETQRSRLIQEIESAINYLRYDYINDRRLIADRSCQVDKVLEHMAYDKAMQQSRQIKQWVQSRIQVVEHLSLYKWSWCKGSVREDGEWYFDFDEALSRSDAMVDGWIERIDGERIRLNLDQHRPTVETVSLALDQASRSLVREHLIELVGVEEFDCNQFRYSSEDGVASIVIKVFSKDLDPTSYLRKLNVPPEGDPLNAAEVTALENHVRSILDF
jgi:hypothetical protein